MPRKCMICKSISNPFEKRSFHMFPKDKLIKTKWIESLNLSNKEINFKTAYICSDHFDEKSFYEHGELHTRSRIHLDAVPQVINTLKTSVVSEGNSEESNTLQDANVDEGINIQQNEITLINSDVEDSDVLKDIRLQSNLDKSSDISTFNITHEMCWTNSNDDISNLNNQTENNSSNSRKRKKPFDFKLKTKIRFMTGFKTEYMCREDFVNEEAWNTFLRYTSHCKSVARAAYSRNQRKEKKIHSLKRMIDMLEQKDELHASEYLKSIDDPDQSPHSHMSSTSKQLQSSSSPSFGRMEANADADLSKISTSMDTVRGPEETQKQIHDAFGEYIAEQLQAMPLHMQIFCKQMINDAIFYAEMKSLNYTSRIVTDPVYLRQDIRLVSDVENVSVQCLDNVDSKNTSIKQVSVMHA